MDKTNEPFGVSDPPGAKALHHVGIVVDELDQAVTFLTEALGLELLFRDVDAAGDAYAFIRCGPVRIELIQLSDPSERAERLGELTARIDHLGIEVADLEALSHSLAARGVRFQSEEPVDRGLGQMIFTAAETTDGVVYQLIEPRARRP